MIKASVRSILLIVPFIIFVIEYFFIQQIYPLYYVSDPAYQYLFNGLLILNGHSPFHIDHPGTPVQILIAGVLYVSWSAATLLRLFQETLDISVGTRPERYLQIISYVLLLMNCTASYILGHRVFKSTLKIGLAFFVQASAVAFGVVFARMSYPEPESLLIFGSMLLIASLAPSIFKPLNQGQTTSAWGAILPGVICGFGVAVKLTFIPMLAMLLLLRSTKSIATSLSAALLSWFVCVSPMIPELPRFFNWINGIATHSGHYGSGASEFINLSEIVPRIRLFTQLFDLWFVVAFCLLGTALGILFWALYKTIRGDNTTGEVRSILKLSFTPTVLFLICIAQTIFVIKHPGERYMIPALIIEAVGIAWLLQRIPKLPRLEKLSTPGYWLLSFVGLTLMLNGAYGSYRQVAAERKIFVADVSQIEVLVAQYDHPLLIGTYGCRLLKCALSFGLGYAPATHPEVGALLTDFFDFNIWAKKLVIKGRGFYELDLITQELNKKRPVLLVTNLPPEQLKSFNLKLIYTGPAQSLYHVTGLNTH
jgi:hypothetical protein